MIDNENNKCPNCGAPLTTEICPYCYNVTGIDTLDTGIEYQVIECKEANVNFWNFWFPMIFAVVFGLFGILFSIPFIFYANESILFIVLLCGVFAVIGVGAFVFAIIPVIRYSKVKIKGKEIEATVYGYMDDNVILNGSPAQIVELLVNTNEGPRFILYQLCDIKRPYKINSKIKLLVYKDIFLVKKEKNYYFE